MYSLRLSRFRVLLGALAIAFILAGCDKTPAPDQGKAKPEVGVYTVSVQPYTITATLPGRTSAYVTSGVRPQVDGIIKKRLFKEGSHVKAGQVLYQIDPATYQAAYDSAKAQLAQARAAVQSARPMAERYKALARIDAVSKQNKDDALATLAQDEATVATGKANLESASINLGYTKVRAPISGIIGASTFTPGALVTANQTNALATINQLDPIYVDIQQTGTQYLQLKHAVDSGRIETIGDNEARVEVTAEGEAGHPMQGRLEFAGVNVDPSTGSVTLRAIVPNSNHDLLPGMYVQAQLDQGIDVKAILVPQQGVTRNTDGQGTCLVVGPDNKVARRKLGIAAAANGNRWRVTSGLAAGDRVIVQGTDKAGPGDTVKPVDVTLGSNGDAQSIGRLQNPPPGNSS